MGRDTARVLAAGLYRETGATRRRERHDTKARGARHSALHDDTVSDTARGDIGP